MAYAGPIKNIVVLMFENRSYDNMLGMLYNETLNKPPFQKAPPGQSNLAGLSGSESNLDPNTGKPVTVWGTNDDPTNLPVVDPGESFYDMSQQILGLPLLPITKNHYPSAPPLTSPTDGYGLTGGYVANFAVQNLYGNPLKNVMHSYLPSLVPVTSYLAHNFMVCDQWYASAPTQTFANRLFSLCANPGGDHHGSFIDDLQYGTSLLSGLNLPSIFDLLENAHAGKGIVPNWKLYFHDVSYSAILLKKVGDLFTSTSNENVGNYNRADYPPGSPYVNPLAHPTNTFIEDVQKKTLAPFTLIEPRYTNNYPGMAPGLSANSNHPGISNIKPGGPPSATNPSIDVAFGEALLWEVYTTLRRSETYWNQTLLIVTYDEHGGLYDHVPPPPATPPGIPNAHNGFAFNWLGGRVPTIIISPYVAAGSQLVAPKAFDHTSIISTAREVFDLAGPFNARDANAPVITLPPNAKPSNNPDQGSEPTINLP